MTVAPAAKSMRRPHFSSSAETRFRIAGDFQRVASCWASPSAGALTRMSKRYAEPSATEVPVSRSCAQMYTVGATVKVRRLKIALNSSA